MAQLLQNSNHSAMYEYLAQGGWADKFDKFLSKFIHRNWNP